MAPKTLSTNNFHTDVAVKILDVLNKELPKSEVTNQDVLIILATVLSIIVQPNSKISLSTSLSAINFCTALAKFYVEGVINSSDASFEEFVKQCTDKLTN